MLHLPSSWLQTRSLRPHPSPNLSIARNVPPEVAIRSPAAIAPPSSAAAAARRSNHPTNWGWADNHGTPSRTSAFNQLRAQPTLVRGLTLLDSVLLLASGIIGSSIFLTAKDIAGPLPQPMLFLLVWVLGGVISLFGCVAFAELGSMFPDSGGQYIYLREAYGDLPAFLYGWMLFSVANGGTIAALSVASAAYMGQSFP